MFDSVWNFEYVGMYSILLVGVSLTLAYRVIRWRHVIVSLAAYSASKRMLHGVSLFRYTIRSLCLFIGILFLLLALCQPQWNKKERVMYQQGRDMFIALDVSKSMLAADCKPTRLECAKRKIKDILASLSSDRVGLILFSGSAFVQCPLTDDYAAFQLFLDQVDVETIASGSTSCDEAIQTALQAFKEVSQTKEKLLILITDGEDFSHNLAGVKEQAIAQALHIIALGVGTTQGAPVPCFDEYGVCKGHQKDKQGNIVISRLNEPMLQAIAKDSAGQYIKMSVDDTDIRSLQHILSFYEKNKRDDRTVTQYEHQYPLFVAVSFICFVLEWFL